MATITFLFRVYPHSLQTLSADYDDEFRVACSYFEEQGVERYRDEIQLVYDYLVGRYSDWHIVSEVLRRSRRYEERLVWDYLPNSPTFFPSADDIREAIMGYALGNFTSEMLMQEPQEESL